MRRKFTKEQIVKIYKDMKTGKSYSKVAREIGVPPYEAAGVISVYKRIDQYLLGVKTINKDSIRANPAYADAYAELSSGVVSTPASQTQTDDAFTFLEKSFARFLKDLETFMDLMMIRKRQDRDEEIEKLKEENAALKEKLETSQGGSWISSLRRKFGR